MNMNLINKIILSTIILQLIAPITSTTYKKNQQVATYKGGDIKYFELKNNSRKTMATLKLQRYKAMSDSLYYLLIERLLRIEAKVQKTTVPKLKQSYLQKNIPKISDNDVQKFYLQNKKKLGNSFESLKFGLREYMTKQSKDEMLQNLYISLFRKYEVNFKLTKPKPFKFFNRELLKNTKDDPSWGDPKSKVVLVEFSDFECPYCQKVQPIIKKLRKDFEKKIYYVFRDFPLGFHFQAKMAHIAANCAKKQKKYFPFHNRVFQASSNLTSKNLLKIAKTVGLNVNKYQNCLKNLMPLNNEIEQDITDGKKLGVDGTPTLFLNGEKMNGFDDYQKIKNKIEQLLKK